MATITYDSQSLLVDGRRIWLVGGIIDYFRIPSALWEDRIKAAVDAGLNTILVRCPWSLHEPRKGDFRFDGEIDVVGFINLIQKYNLRCVLRLGPFVGHDLDLGGMPSWLLAEEGLKLREGNSIFLEATSKYLGRLLKILAPYSGTKGGSIVLVQIEHEWYCGNQDAAASYLLEIARFVREHDFDLPMINTNNLWQHREETIDTWNGRDEMLMHLRQLRMIHPSKPLIVGDYWAGEIDTWSHERISGSTPEVQLHQLGQIAAAGAQFIISPFHGGTNFGFMASRLVGHLDKYGTTSSDCQAPLSETGEPSPSYYQLRRLCMFTSHFGKVFAAIDPNVISAVLAVEPSEESKKSSKGGFSVVHLRGSQGSVLFVFGDPAKANQTTHVLLPSGQRLPIQFDSQSVAWCLMDVHLSGQARLDWTNLNAFAMVGNNILILHGASGQKGLISINYSLLEVEVPRRQIPLVEIHEDIILIICNSNSIDTTYIHDNKVHVGISGFDSSGEPISAPDWRNRFIITDDGVLTKIPNEQVKTVAISSKIEGWKAATIDDYIDGSAPRYATIDGPSTQEQCSAGSGYGLLRISLQDTPSKKVKLLVPHIGDRVHFYMNGQLQCMIGYGPGAKDDVFDLTLPGGNVELVALIDNLGRYGGGNDMAEGKGVISDLFEVTTIKLDDPVIVENTPVKPFDLRNYIEGLHDKATTSGQDLEWTFSHSRESDLILQISNAQMPAVVLVNNIPVAYYSGHTGRPKLQLLLTTDQLVIGENKIRLSPFIPAKETDLAGAVTLYESRKKLTTDAKWAFAKWEQPKQRAFISTDKVNPKDFMGKPVWYKANFPAPVTDKPIWLEPVGMSKGQIFLNGINVGRYFVALASGRSVGPQKRYYLPTPWLRQDKDNELVIFDEHGRDPSRIKIVSDDSAF